MPTDSPARRPLARWLIPLATFGAGAVVALVLTPKPAPPLPVLDVPTFGSSSSGAGSAGAPTDSALQGELALMRDINGKFVGQLREYETRLRAIATLADDESAPDAAAAMRDFALETEALIDRYDLIVKKN